MRDNSCHLWCYRIGAGMVKNLLTWWHTTCEFCWHVRNIISLCYIILALIGLFLIVYWATIDNIPPVEVIGGQVLNHPIAPGDVMHIRWQYKKYRHCDGIITRKITGCGLWEIEQLASTAPPTDGNIQNIIIHVRSPDELPLGDLCLYGTHAHYVCNPFHYLFPIEQEFPSVPFLVAKEEAFSFTP